MFQQLLIDLFKFLAPFLRNAELAKQTHLLYKVSSSLARLTFVKKGKETNLFAYVFFLATKVEQIESRKAFRGHKCAGLGWLCQLCKFGGTLFHAL